MRCRYRSRPSVTWSSPVPIDTPGPLSCRRLRLRLRRDLRAKPRVSKRADAVYGPPTVAMSVHRVTGLLNMAFDGSAGSRYTVSDCKTGDVTSRVEVWPWNE